MTKHSYETTAAFHELMDLIRQADTLFLDGPRAVSDEVSVVEGYGWLTAVLSIALDLFLWADPERPAITPSVSPTRKYSGDNSDAFYYYAPVNPTRTYRVWGNRGDAEYMSLTIYGGSNDGHWTNRIVSTLNDREMEFADDNSFDVILSPDKHPGNWMKLDHDAVRLVIRDYLIDPVNDRKASWHIEAVDAAPPPRATDADVARRLRAATTFLRDAFGVFPIAIDETKINTIEEPYPGPKVTFGHTAADAAYAMGAFDLHEDQALIIEGTSPECAFWNMCLWNTFLQTYDYRYERVTINGGQVKYEKDGSWKIIIAHRDPGLPNWVSTASHRRGLIWFRWFLADFPPSRPRCNVIQLSDLGKND